MPRATAEQGLVRVAWPAPTKNDEQAILEPRLLPGTELKPNHKLPFRVDRDFARPEKTAYFFFGSGLGGAAGFKPAAASCKSLTAVAPNSYSAGSFSRFAT